MSPEQLGAALFRGSRDHYQDAVLYDYEYRRRRLDVRFYRRLAGQLGGPVLELGCGTGRIAIPLARDGHRVVGVDLNLPMLLRARERTERLPRARRDHVQLLRADMCQLPLTRRFPLVFSAFNTLQHIYESATLIALLSRLRRHLVRGGCLAFDVMNPDLAWLSRDERRRWARTRFRHPRTGEPMVYTTNHTYDPVSQLALIRLYYEAADGPRKGRTQVVRLAHRQYFPQELRMLVQAAGLAVALVYGGFDGEALSAESESQVLLCCRPDGVDELRHRLQDAFG